MLKLPFTVNGPVSLTSPSETIPPTDLISSQVIEPVLKFEQSTGPVVLNPPAVFIEPSTIILLLNIDCPSTVNVPFTLKKFWVVKS